MSKKLLGLILAGVMLLFAGCQNAAGDQSTFLAVSNSSESQTATPSENILAGVTSSQEINPLALSDRIVRITSSDNTATFQLYDTVAATEFYEQLPLTLELSNFRDAQWMFYPPEQLHVTTEEAYHDGKKGELSYYEPWGDAFMLYKDFYAGDEMHRLGVGLTGIDDIATMSGSAVIEKVEVLDNNPKQKVENKMKITVGDTVFTATLADNSSAEALLELLVDDPLTIAMSDYGGFEKVGPLGASLPTNNEQIITELGDIILYQGNSLVIYYAPNSWSFTRLGRIDDLTGLREALGDGDVSVTLSMI